MTPAARVQAAIELLDRILDGAPAEKALTGWARGARYAGSKDRAAVRDYVYQALRCRDSYAAQGGGLTGRSIMLGQIGAEGIDPSSLFTGAPYAPAPLSESERAAQSSPQNDPVDLPVWLWEKFAASLGSDGATEAANALRQRAPVTVRVNGAKTTRERLSLALSQEGIMSEPVPGIKSALRLTEGARRLTQSHAYNHGEVELQDAHSQAAMACLELEQDARILDFCAGGGGKTLALAAQVSARFFAHDADPRRMADLPARARRAGVRVDLLTDAEATKRGPFDLVLCDVPCSGSGTWRRAPEAKWALTPARFEALVETQAQILRRAAELVRPDGRIAYTTCSVLREENEAQINAFVVKHPDFRQVVTKAWPINEIGDGFFLSILTR